MGWTLVVGGAFVVLTAFESVSSLRSLESREQVEEMLAEPPGSGLGLGVEGVLDLMHVLTLVTGACAAAIAVLGWQVLQRDRRARVAVSVLAVPLFAAGTAVGGVLTAVVAAAAALLWLQPTRAWFDGTTPPPSRGLGEPLRRRPPQPPHPLPPQVAPPHTSAAPGSAAPGSAGESGEPGGPGAEPRPYDGFGSVRTAPAPDPAPQAPTPVGRPGGAPYAAVPRRPAAVTVACVLTWAASAAVGLLTAVSLVALALAPDLLLEEALRQQPELLDGGVTRGALLASVWVLGVLTVLWCVAASVVAAFALRGAPWARTALLVCGIVASVLSLLVTQGAVVAVLPMLAGSVTVACLLRSESRAFFARGVVR